MRHLLRLDREFLYDSNLSFGTFASNMIISESKIRAVLMAWDYEAAIYQEFDFLFSRTDEGWKLARILLTDF